MRKLTSYKFYSIHSIIKRNSRLWINKEKIKASLYLNVGSSSRIEDSFINLDYKWQKGLDICWDITQLPLPLNSSSLKGIFTEHCIEHISFDNCQEVLTEFYRILQPGGVLRVIVPDGELYFDLYKKAISGEKIVMPYGEGEFSPMYSVNRIFRSHGHQFIYDFDTLNKMLKVAGFETIERKSFKNGSNPDLLIDNPEREIESLYLEAVK